MKLSRAQEILSKAIDHWLGLDPLLASDADYIVPCLVGSPGLGKTTSVIDETKRRKIGIRILSLAQYDAGELAGWNVPAPDGESMIRMRPDWMPDSGKGAIFVDEISQAPVACQNIAAQLVNERRVGPHHLPPGWVVIAATNKASDRAGTNNMPSHLKDRLMFLEIEADLEDSVAYMVANGVDPRVTAFLRFRPEYLHKFDRDADACPSPRSWQKASAILSWDMEQMSEAEALSGQIGRAATADFTGFCRLYDTVPDMDELFADPMAAKVSEDPAVTYAVCAAISYRMTTDNMGQGIKYLRRLPQREFAAFSIKDAINRDPKLKKVQAFRDWVMADGRELLL